MVVTEVASPELKRERLKQLRAYHQQALDKLGVPNAVFIPKLAYKPSGKNEVHVSFFISEISKGEDVYMEFTNRNNVPEDPKRTLYKWRYNPHYATEYEATDPNTKPNDIRYLVPVAELQVIKSQQPETPKLSTKITEVVELSLPDPNLDLPIDQLTIRDLAAILLKKPCSQKSWLNDIITRQ